MTTATADETRVQKRAEVRREDTWDLEAMFAKPEDWEADFAALDALLAPVLAMKGKLAGAAAVASLFRAQDDLHRRLEKLYSYASHREDEDTSNSTNQARKQRLSAKFAEIAGKTAWVRPEILAQSLETLKAWKADKALADYTFSMDQLIRQKPHTLSDAEETLLSKASEIFHGAQNTFGYLTNADMKWPEVVDADGKKHPLTNGRYIPFLENRDRSVRRQAFEKYYDGYIANRNTLASTLATNVKVHNFNAGVRGFGSALEASLHPDNIPVKVYDALIEAVHGAHPSFYEFVDLRKRTLGLADLNMWDLHVPIVPNFEVKVSWKEACEWVLESCRPLGDEYMGALRECFNDRWIDVYENEGKRSGAYSGGCYDSKPYVLMNYQGTLDWVFTLAHELGHSLHTWLAKKNQRYRESDYTIFVAEIASTTNEMLLHNWLLENKASDPRFRAYLYNHLSDSFKGTVFRQTMFAEFERMIHEMDAAGEPLTADALNEAYYALNAKYFGPAVKADARIGAEWSRIPHFYYNFYVYKYATGFCAAQVFSRNILAGGAGREAYLNMLRAGGSNYPLDVVKAGGVDLTDPKVLAGAFNDFRASVAELGRLVAG